MKALFTIIATVIFVTAYAQSPEKISYQAVIRNASNELIVNKTVGIKISILKGSASGAIAYTETQTPLTNASGLISIQFGGGAGFNSIDWSSGVFFCKTEVDPLGGENYTITSTSQLLSVPYALYSNFSDSSKYVKNETDPIFGASIAKGINASDTARWNAKSLSGAYVISKHSFDSAINALRVDLLNELALAMPSGQIKDSRDNQAYKFVKLGDQIWMAQNLNYYTSSGSYYYNNDSVTYASTYGRLYQWETAKHVCPSGWHLPSEAEFIELMTYLGAPITPGQGYPTAGKLKETGTTHWQAPNTNATNSTGFNGVPAGFWYTYGSTFINLHQEARFWTSTEKPIIPGTAAPFTLQYDSDYVRDFGFLANYKTDGLSVRCLKTK